ncbi:MAG: hypothetical protein AAF961_17825, partial [Planctomycetota bacterium]
RRLVQEAEPGTAQSTGVTIVQLLWLELLGQWRIAAGACPSRDGAGFSDPFRDDLQDRQLGRHLRLIGAKLTATESLRRLELLELRRAEAVAAWTEGAAATGDGASDKGDRREEFFGRVANRLRAIRPSAEESAPVNRSAAEGQRAETPAEKRPSC